MSTGDHPIRPGPIEEYYRGLKKEEEPACLADYAGEIDAVLKAEEEVYRARRHAEWRLRLAGQFMANYFSGYQLDKLEYPRISDLALQAADALLARWKETTPEVEPATSLLTDQIDALSPDDFGKGFEAAVSRVDSEGGEA